MAVVSVKVDLFVNPSRRYSFEVGFDILDLERGLK